MNIIAQLAIVGIVAIVIVYFVLNLDNSGNFDSLKSFGGLPKVEMPTLPAWTK